MPWYFFNWLILFTFFFCKIIFFFVNPTVLHFLIRELNGNIEQIMWFDGTFMQMNFWKTSTHIIFVIRRAILHQVQVVEKWWFTLSEHQNPISRDGKFFLRSPLCFTIVMITVYWQKALRIFLRINRESFRILRIFCFESFFGTYNVYFYIASNFFRISTFHKVRARRLLELGSELKNAIISQMIFKLWLWVLYLSTQKQWKFDIAKRHHCQTMLQWPKSKQSFSNF